MVRVFSRLVVGLLLVGSVTDAQPPLPGGSRLILNQGRSPLLRPVRGGEPWLGVSVHKATEALKSSLEAIPVGVGFVVSEVVPDSPAARAGLRQYDFLWKLNDQMLVNEAQFLVLLHLHKVGEAVRLTLQRGEETHEVKVVLSNRPTSETGRPQAEILIMKGPPMPELPHQMVQKLRQVASVRGDDGVLVQLERKGAGYHWQQVSADGVVMNQGDVAGLRDIHFPEGTKVELEQKLQALIRAVEDAQVRAQSGNRQPRVRRVPTGDLNKVPNPR